MISFADECRIAKERNLKECLGNIFEHTPKQVIAVTKCQEDDGLLYLCTWHQDLEEIYLVPSWVQSVILAEVGGF